MTNRLLNHVLMLTWEGYEVLFSYFNLSSIKIRLQKDSFIIERILDVTDFGSCSIDGSLIVICILNDMKAEFEKDMKLRSKMKGENNE